MSEDEDNPDAESEIHTAESEPLLDGQRIEMSEGDSSDDSDSEGEE